MARGALAAPPAIWRAPRTIPRGAVTRQGPVYQMYPYSGPEVAWSNRAFARRACHVAASLAPRRPPSVAERRPTLPRRRAAQPPPAVCMARTSTPAARTGSGSSP